MPALIATELRTNTGDRPIDSKKAEEDLFGSASDCEGVSNGGGVTLIHAVLLAHKKSDGKGTTFHGGYIYVPSQPWV